MRGDEGGSFFTVILGPVLPWDLQRDSISIAHSLWYFSPSSTLFRSRGQKQTYGDDGLRSGVPLVGPSWEVVDMREGEEFAGPPVGGAKVGQFFGLGSRVVCGEDNGAAVTDATAVDMVLPTRKKKRARACGGTLQWYLERSRRIATNKPKTK